MNGGSALHSRGAGGYPGHARSLGGDNQHQGGGEEGVGAAGDIAAAGADRDYPVAQDGTGYIGEAVQLGQAALLCQGKLADVVRSPAQIVQFLLGHLGVGCVNLLPGDPQRGAAVAVKAAVILHQGAVAPGADGLNDLSHAAAPLRHLIRRADGRFLQVFHRG